MAATETRTSPSFCRICLSFCPILVTTRGNEVVKVEGDRENEVWNGHTCVKGRAQPAWLTSERRLLHSQRRSAAGTYEPVAIDAAMDEIAARLQAILDEHGPDAVAFYQGSGSLQHTTTDAFAHAFLDEIRCRLRFTPNTIDKPGKSLAKALHGNWQAPAQGFDDPDCVLLFGVNPIVTYEGAPLGHPGWFHDRVAAGMKLVVVDPRQTETARQATLHLRPRPGHDAAILAAIIRVILAESLEDRAFVDEEVAGVEELRTAVEPFTPEAVAAAAGIHAEGIVRAARSYAAARRGYTFSGTGPSMSSPGPLMEYLVLCLQSICGRWLRAGEQVRNVPAVWKTPTYRAQAGPQTPALREDRPFGVRGLLQSVAGPPTAALPERILLEEGSVRALISCGGNPVGAWPGQSKVVEAMKSLDLLVQIDPVMSETARLADFVIAPKMALETPDVTVWHDFMALHGTGYGNAVSHGQYTEALVDPPEGSEVVGEWEFFYGLAQRMGLQLTIKGTCYGNRGMDPFQPDMAVKPDEEELLERITHDSRIPLDEVKRHPHGAPFPDPPVFVQPKEDEWPHRLLVGAPEMTAALDELAAGLAAAARDDGELRLICRRTRTMFNSWLNDGAAARGRTHNPAYLHPDDLDRLGLAPGDIVEIRSEHGAVRAIVERDDDLLPGLVSISHGYGAVDGDGAPVDDPRGVGCSIQRLLSHEHADPYSGMPLMSNVPVHLAKSVG
jgi:anaerobic selenocysteine-containing dehydrogenase